MASVHDVAAYIVAHPRGGEMSTWKLQKLIYYAQAWSLVWDDDVLFPEPIEAWANGPVVHALYRTHSGRFIVNPSWAREVGMGDPDRLTAAQKVTVDGVLAGYGQMTGRQLSHLTHSEAPWADTREGLGPTDRSRREISLSGMQAFYLALDTDDDAKPVETIDWNNL